MVTPVTSLKGKDSFLELVLRDYFYSIRISVQDIMLTLAIVIGSAADSSASVDISSSPSFSFTSDPMTVCQPGTAQ